MPYVRAKVKGKYVPQSPKILDQMREVLRYHHYAIRTEEAYVTWVYRFMQFHQMRHPKEMGKQEIEQFLSDLALNRKVAASTQQQAMNALLFLYKEILDRPIAETLAPIKSKKPKRLPTVLSRAEVGRLLNAMEGTHQLLTKLLYSSGLRLIEAVRSRVNEFLVY